MKKVLLLCFFTLLGTCVSAQTIKGQLTDGAGLDPMGFANVSVYDANDKLVKGTSSDIGGRYEFIDLPARTYRLKVSFLGYVTEMQTVSLFDAKSTVEVPNITLGEGGNKLDEVTVTAERAVMELGLGRKVFNVEKSIAAAGGNAEDLLREIPSITVDLEGNVSLRGSGGVRFLINGKPSAMTQQASFLQTMTASNIERVEVLTNPGAQFDPEGTAGLINIVLKQKRADGFNATVNLNAGTGNKFDGSIDANWNRGKFNTTFTKPGRNLSASFQFSESDRSEVESYDEFIYSGDGSLLDEVNQNSPSANSRTQYFGQLDYSQKIGEDFKFEAGWRSTLQRLDNIADFNVYDDDLQQFFKVDSNSNRFFYDEDVHAVYGAFGGKVDNFTFSAGPSTLAFASRS